MFRSAADALVTLEKHFSGVSTRYLLAPNARLELFRVFPALANCALDTSIAFMLAAIGRATTSGAYRCLT